MASAGSYEWAIDPKESMAALDSMFGDAANSEMYDPPSEKRISKDGAWVMVLREPPFGPPLDGKIRMGMAFYALHPENTDESGFNTAGYYKVEIRTPWGNPHLWPYEYFIPDWTWLSKLFQDGELAFHPYAESERVFSEQLFYVRTRGIGLSEAIPLVLGSVKGPIGWFEPTAHVRDLIAATYGRTAR